MKKGNFIRYIAAALVVLALVACAPFAFAESEAAPETKTNNVMVVSLNTGATIYQKNAKQKIYPASTTKLMTMAVALEMIDNLDEEVVFDKTAAYADLVVGSSNMGLKDGEKISLHHMMYGIALSSANEGTNMVAIHLCGSIEAFVKKMNQKAAEWGMKNTHYVNTHGLTDENHYTTAEDMAILAKHVFSDERLLPYISAGSYTLPKTNKNPERTLISTNQLLRANSGNYYKYAVAGKTGSTSAAGYNLISMAKYKGMEYIAITMNASYKENDTNPVFEDSIALYKWAFSNFSVQSLLAEETSVYEMSVQLCAKSDHVLLMPKGAVDAVIENGSKVEDYKTVDLFKGVDAAERSKVLEFMKAHPQTPLAELGASYYAWREAAALKGVTDQKKIQKIKGGEELTLADQTAKTVLNNYTQGLKSEGEQKYLWFILAEQEADAPIVKGADFGDVIIAERNTQGELVAEYGRVDLVAANDLERSNILYYLDVIRNVFNNIYVRLAVIILVLLIVAYIIFMIWQNKKKRRRRIARRIKF